MDREAFLNAIEATQARQSVRKGIGTLGEKTLHATLKFYLEPLEDSHEIRVGSFVADIVGEDGIIEIQTRNLNQMRKKLAAFLEVAPVTVVYPIPRTKWLTWVDPDTGEITKKRKSPKRGSFYHAFYELYKIKMFLPHPNLRMLLILLDLEEYRYLNGWSHDRKRGSSRCERIPLALADELELRSATDYLSLLPDRLPESFSSKDYASFSGLRQRDAQTALNVLCHVGAIRRVGKQGRLNLYEAIPL